MFHDDTLWIRNEQLNLYSYYGGCCAVNNFSNKKHVVDLGVVIVTSTVYYLAPGGGCEVLFSPGLSVCLCVCLSVCLCICVSGQYFGILFLGY